MAKFISLDKVARTATFEVGGQQVTRRIPAQYAGTIDDYLSALAQGLEVESAKAQEPVKVIDDTILKVGDVVSEKLV